MGMGPGMFLVVRPALWSSNSLLGLLAPCATPVGVWVLWDYGWATSTLTPCIYPSPGLRWGGEGLGHPCIVKCHLP